MSVPLAADNEVVSSIVTALQSSHHMRISESRDCIVAALYILKERGHRGLISLCRLPKDILLGLPQDIKGWLKDGICNYRNSPYSFDRLVELGLISSAPGSK